jgi:hypothetical protein
MKKKEEKDARRQREQGMAQARADHEHELRKARERDAQAGVNRDRRKSFNAGPPGAPGAYPFPPLGGGNPGYPVAGTGYPPSPYSGYGDAPPLAGGGSGYPGVSSSYSRDRKYSSGGGAGYSDLDRQFGDLDLDRDRNRGYGDRERKTSGVGARLRKYSTSDGGERGRAISGNLGARPEYGAGGTYGPPSGPYNSRSYSSNSGAAQHASPNMRAASPNIRPGDAYIPNAPSGYPGSNYSSSPARGPGEPPLPRSTTPFGGGGPAPAVYPRGHVREGQPMSHSRAPSPMPGAHGQMGPPAGPYSSGSVAFPLGGPSPHMPGPIAFPSEPVAQLAAPEGFSRSVNGNFPFTSFDIIKVQDMEHFWEEVPRMPVTLMDHDVLDRDWDRLMQVRRIYISVKPPC